VPASFASGHVDELGELHFEQVNLAAVPPFPWLHEINFICSTNEEYRNLERWLPRRILFA
jgi:hypothetical protein